MNPVEQQLISGIAQMEGFLLCPRCGAKERGGAQCTRCHMPLDPVQNEFPEVKRMRAELERFRAVQAQQKKKTQRSLAFSAALMVALLAGLAFLGWKQMFGTGSKHRACDAPLVKPREAVEACTWLIDNDEGLLGPSYNNRGLAKQALGQYDDAIEDFDMAVTIAPMADMVRNRADTHNMRGAYAEALADYNLALDMEPGNPSLLNNAAWFLATCPEEKYRDGERAVRLARKAVEELDVPSHRSTLAAAYAETGEFDRAITLMEIVLKEEPHPLSREALEAFKKRKPYRASPPE